MLWRRSYDVPSPPIADDSPLSQAARLPVRDPGRDTGTERS